MSDLANVEARRHRAAIGYDQAHRQAVARLASGDEAAVVIPSLRNEYRRVDETNRLGPKGVNE